MSDTADLDPRAASSVPLAGLPLPTRLFHWAERAGVTTVGELLRIDPTALLAERNIGVTTIRSARAALADLGLSWGRGDEEPRADHRPSADVASARLDVLDFPKRLLGWAARAHVSTVAELLLVDPASVLAERNVGRNTIKQTKRRLSALGCAWERPPPAPPAPPDRGEAFASMPWLDAFEALLSEQPDRRRVVLLRRSGSVGAPETLRDVGARIGVSRERARMIEAEAFTALRERRAWITAILSRVDAALDAGPAPLDVLAEDAWWTGIAQRPPVLAYLLERLLGGAAHVVELDGRAQLARFSVEQLEQAWSGLRAAMDATPLPAPLATFAAMADHARDLLECDVLRPRMEELLVVDAPSRPDAARGPGVERPSSARVLSIGTTKMSERLAALRASPEPLRFERLGGRRLPEGVIRLGRGLVGMERHFPDMEEWSARLVPRVLRLMKKAARDAGASGRQHTALELLAALRDEPTAPPFPDWFTPAHLSAVLARSDRLRYLGRWRFALPGVGALGRINYRVELVRILRAHGAPMPLGALRAELRRGTDATAIAVSTTLHGAPFVSIPDEGWGLVDRDLPGGRAAVDEVWALARRLLARRPQGIPHQELYRKVGRLSTAHARWTTRMTADVLRADARFRVRGGRVMFAAKASGAAAFRPDLVLPFVRGHGGRVRTAELLSFLEGEMGVPTGWQTLARFAKPMGLKMGAGWIGERAAPARRRKL